jgi:RimJ/RimL family protein N-acetyltransferase
MNVLETERLTLRQITADDAPFILEILNEPAFIRFVADRGVRTVADATEYIAQKMTPSYAQFGFGTYLVALKENGTPIGTCGLIKREALEDVDIGYSFLERFWGRGFAYEAAVAVMNYGREVCRLPRIVAITSPENHSSIKLLEKLGLRSEKTIQLPGFDKESKFFV